MKNMRLPQIWKIGTIYTEQIRSVDFTVRHWEKVEKIPADLLDEIRKKATLVLQ
ncbi:hypothetical protein LFYK43_17900 [Ligilactobacillus salitolerans]|uniref:Uncharacterized protein n=1 Tax=Ligilactobacillus salitolerans TaxID=1808352 RepID=A0A401IUW4_9LACO|nr:hypothetical protein LFYK43_17900 [Ligilactobacillus salitolerans]